jgi:DNA replication licensing factor MCM6
VTVRALESLIRLSEGIARCHCDPIIRPNYVREVCRLMRNSNINIIKGDVDFSDLQEEINKDRLLLRRAEGESKIAL